MPPETKSKQIDTLVHRSDTRKNIPTKEMEAVLKDEDKSPIQVSYERRNRDLDPQLVWRGKDEQNWSDLVAQAPPLFIQEKVHPKVLIDDLRRQSKDARAKKSASEPGFQSDIFADFNGLPSEDAKTEFYQHDANWSNRMILGDSLQVMASLAEREGLRGKVQCIYIDPPYGIKFNSNFQWSTTSRDVKDGKADHITREPEQVKAFRDTWRDGVHSYLTYLRDRLTVARDLLTESGSVFVQIGDENVHRVRALMDEVFGEDNFISLISIQTTTGFLTDYLGNMSDFVLWFAKNKPVGKARPPLYRKDFSLGEGNARWLMFPDFTYRGVSAPEKRGDTAIPPESWPYKPDNIISQGRAKEPQPFEYQGKTYDTWEKNSHWKANYPIGMRRLGRAGRIHVAESSIQYVRYHTDFDVGAHGNIWSDTGTGNFTDDKIYVVQTNAKVIERCILMATDPGDLVLDPTCGSGTTAYVAEQWGRRWITIDTSRVALALARARIMGARYPYYLLADSSEGQIKEADIADKHLSEAPTYNDIRQGFVYERVPHVTLKSIANNAEIDVIYEKFQETLELLRANLNKALKKKWEEWEIPREAEKSWPPNTKKLHADWWKQRIARQNKIDASIAAKADYEYLYDKPYQDNRRVRVSGPFTVESLSPHRIFVEDENGNERPPQSHREQSSFVERTLETLKIAGVQQAHKEGRIAFSALDPWPGHHICAEASYDEGKQRRRAAIFIGPEYGTVSRADLAATAREAAEAGFDILIACAFSYEAACSELTNMGKIAILQARMNADLYMSTDLKDSANSNLFVVFGQPDIEVKNLANHKIQVRIRGVDVFHPGTGQVESSGPGGIAMWFIDSDYNEESFFVRQAYFLGAGDPYKSLKTTLRTEINAEAWESLNSDKSRPFEKPSSGRIAVKAINHLGDEVMKVFEIKAT